MTGISSNMVKDLLIVACARALMTCVILILIKYYKSFLIKEEHEERYRRLILLRPASKVKYIS